MGTVIPIFADRYEREAVRYMLHEASEAAQKRLGEFETDDHIQHDSEEFVRRFLAAVRHAHGVLTPNVSVS